jgi:hypothetical protein
VKPILVLIVESLRLIGRCRFGAMIDLLPDLLDISPSWHRALKAILTHPAGFNLRNRLSHAAHAIHTALWLELMGTMAPLKLGLIHG